MKNNNTKQILVILINKKGTIWQVQHIPNC